MKVLGRVDKKSSKLMDAPNQLIVAVYLAFEAFSCTLNTTILLMRS